jgi:hypothetical protein
MPDIMIAGVMLRASPPSEGGNSDGDSDAHSGYDDLDDRDGFDGNGGLGPDL